MKIKKLLSDLIDNKYIKFNHLVSRITKDKNLIIDNCIYVLRKNQTLNDEELYKIKTIIVEEDNPLLKNFLSQKSLNIVICKDLKKEYIRLINCYYQDIDFPFMIGVTGTCGKTTSTLLLYHVLKEVESVCLIGGSGIYHHTKESDDYAETVNTTPSIEIIYENIFKYDVKYVIIEVSSQGLDDFRLEGIKFDLVTFNNFSSEHLDHHLTIENYLNSKLKLFKKLNPLGLAVINEELFIYQQVKNNLPRNYYSFTVNDVKSINQTLDYQVIDINNSYVKTKLVGKFNLENIALVKKIIELLKINVDVLINVLNNNFYVKGRFNLFNLKKRTFIIDYAHTSFEVKSLFKHLTFHKTNRLISVIGCGGNRDKLKRPIIGDIVTKNSDLVIFTSDNNRNEQAMDIIKDILQGVKDRHNFNVIINRYEAIHQAVKYSKSGDIIVIIGRGVERYKIANDDLLWTDELIVKEVIKNVE